MSEAGRGVATGWKCGEVGACQRKDLLVRGGGACVRGCVGLVGVREGV